MGCLWLDFEVRVPNKKAIVVEEDWSCLFTNLTAGSEQTRVVVNVWAELKVTWLDDGKGIDSKADFCR